MCQSANPLGRCLEFVHDDVEAMAKEHEHWRAISKAKLVELAEEEALTESSLREVQLEMSRVEAEAVEVRGAIRFHKAAILRNDAQIERLLYQVVRRS